LVCADARPASPPHLLSPILIAMIHRADVLTVPGVVVVAGRRPRRPQMICCASAQ